ncbi:MAG TPA: hypothetical protein PK771_10245 [Spirochaetota bacterium]|nr:hypothetical protein [Spirochaetota bacterium]
MKKSIYLLLSLSLLLFFGCSPDVGKIKKDLMGKSTYRADTKYWWDFEKISEIKECKIISKNETKDKAEYIVNLRMEDSKDKDKFFLELVINYKKEKGKWIMEKIYQRNYNKIL